jgi:hypothetical protein
MERRVGDADQPLTVEEVTGESKLKFERLHMKFWKKKFYSVDNSSENVNIVVKLGTSHSSARIVQTTMVEITETELNYIFARTVANGP